MKQMIWILAYNNKRIINIYFTAQLSHKTA